MKHLFLKLLSIVVLLVLPGCQERTPKDRAVNLLCEYLVNPIGLDAEEPRFRWEVASSGTGFLQEGYELFIGTDSIAVSQGEGNVWESGKIEDPHNLAVYSGNPLEAFTKYYWGVKLMGRSTALPVSEIASFETGMMNLNAWKGTWISDNEDINFKPAPYFRKEFKLSRKLKEARVYIAAAGLFEFYINEKKIGNHRLDPMYTRFDKRNLYLTYDVTKELQDTDVAMGVVLGNGWYNHQSTAVWDFDKAQWRARPRFCLNLRLVFEDGSTATYVTDDTWKTSTGPVIFNSIYTAEHYDGRLEEPGWSTPGFNDKQWKQVITAEAPSTNIVAQALHPIRNVEEIKPVSIRKLSDRKYIYDLGRNISGVSKLSVEGQSGTTLRLTHAEQLDSTGNIDISNIDVHYRPADNSDPFQTDIFILKGKGLETFLPKFNYKGFQYVEVESDQPMDLSKENLTGIFMHSDVPIAGKVSSSNEIIDKIWAATNASYLSNLFGYPTDCPQREKNGWTGDAHIAVETGLYNFDAITIYEKWMDDHRDEQQPNGVLPSIIPTWGWGYEWGNGPDWTSSIAIIPWELYQFYGDSHALEENYDNIKKYVDHITELSPSGLTDWGLGDWVPVKDQASKELTSSIYYYVDTNILAKTAQLLGKEMDHIKYEALAKRIRKGINEKFLNTETGIYADGYQTELSAALYWNIVPKEYIKLVARNLADKVIADNNHINVGLLGTKTILNALSENGYASLAYEMASQDTFPSWGYWIKNGATTLYENRDINAGSDLSRNHIMFGAIGEWFYKGLGGIFPDPANPGFKNVILKPNFVEGLEEFMAIHKGPYGEIVSGWKKGENNFVTYNVVIPPNSRAKVYLKGKKIKINGKEISLTTNDFTKIDLEGGAYHILIEQIPNS